MCKYFANKCKYIALPWLHNTCGYKNLLFYKRLTKRIGPKRSFTGNFKKTKSRLNLINKHVNTGYISTVQIKHFS